jgi:hypothetical protein
MRTLDGVIIFVILIHSARIWYLEYRIKKLEKNSKP